MSTRVLTAKFGKSKANLPATESWQIWGCSTGLAACVPWFSKHKRNEALGTVPVLALLGPGVIPPVGWQPCAERPGELGVG